MSIFYRKVLADAQLRPFFEGMDMGRMEAITDSLRKDVLCR